MQISTKNTGGSDVAPGFGAVQRCPTAAALMVSGSAAITYKAKGEFF